MRTQSIDTSPEIERIQIEMMRRLTPYQRYQMAGRLTRSVFTLSWNNFKRLHSDLEGDELDVLWVRTLYGDDLADRLAVYLQKRRAR